MSASRFRAGDLVEVRSREEILAMLGPDGRMWRDRLPFMPEMLQYCGRRFRIANVAHKTCDTATRLMGRRMRDTVFLEDLRCDGSAHGGCQARCLLFWRTQWLKPVEPVHPQPERPSPKNAPRCTERQLQDSTSAVNASGETRYTCQATEHWAASEPMEPLSLWHFIEDVRSRNTTVGEVIRAVGLNLVWRMRFLGTGYRLSLWLYDRVHRLITGKPDPYRPGRLPDGARTPEEKLDLRPGEWVEVKSQDEILDTVTKSGFNRGMAWGEELTLACGEKFRVAQRVSKIIDEANGRMIEMKNPCITLEGFYCKAHYTQYSLLCSRRAVPYFREIWLKRVPSDEEQRKMGSEQVRP